VSVPPPSPANSTLQLKVSLLDVSPEIWRRALVPGSITLPKFDRTLQELMGWWNYHLHMFVINDQSYWRFREFWYSHFVCFGTAKTTFWYSADLR
jgi:hypothetical protein